MSGVVYIVVPVYYLLNVVVHLIVSTETEKIISSPTFHLHNLNVGNEIKIS